MTNADVASPASVIRIRSSSSPASSFKYVFGDAIHKEFSPFSLGPYYSTYPEGGIVKNYEFTREEWDVPHHPTLTVLTKEVFKDPSVCKTMRQVTGLNDNLFASDAACVKSKAKEKDSGIEKSFAIYK
nr:hypothetical protein [Tanacetum cinerariifolium]